jgi:hypothetical protein
MPTQVEAAPYPTSIHSQRQLHFQVHHNQNRRSHHQQQHQQQSPQHLQCSAGNDIVNRLEQRVAVLLPHVSSVIQSAALAVLLLTIDTKGKVGSISGADAWFQSRLGIGGAEPWEVSLASWMMPALVAFLTDDNLALARIETGLR